MKVDWKKVAASAGYISLKAAYIKDVKKDQDAALRHGCRPFRSKEEFRRKFKWVIGRAVHYAHIYNRPVESFLWMWESDRDYWWLNYYQEGRQPKKHSNSLRPRNYKGRVKSKKKPPRWSKQYKASRQWRARYTKKSVS